MEIIFEVVLFFFLNCYVAHGKNSCPTSVCGNSTLTIKYPFLLQNQSPPSDCTYFKLTCNDTQSTILLSLPYFGDFYVQNIDYIGQYIKLYDPGDCLMRRLMNLNLSSSYFETNTYYNYTFYVCPLDSEILGNQIGCLSNSTNSTIATRDLPKESLENIGCKAIGSWLIPVSLPGQLKVEGICGDLLLFLSWNATVCRDCDENDNQDDGGWSNKPLPKTIAMIFSVPAIVIMALSCWSGFCFHLMKMIGNQQEADQTGIPISTSMPHSTEATAIPPLATTENAGLDESKIKDCTEIIVFRENESIPGANNAACSICLDNYIPRETIRRISKCDHFFHATCIEQWLQKNGTCPVCRTSLSNVTL